MIGIAARVRRTSVARAARCSRNRDLDGEIDRRWHPVSLRELLGVLRAETAAVRRRSRQGPPHRESSAGHESCSALRDISSHRESSIIEHRPTDQRWSQELLGALRAETTPASRGRGLIGMSRELLGALRAETLSHWLHLCVTVARAARRSTSRDEGPAEPATRVVHRESCSALYEPRPPQTHAQFEEILSRESLGALRAETSVRAGM